MGLLGAGPRPLSAGSAPASCLPDAWRWSVCRACWAQPALYEDESLYKPPAGFPGWDVLEKILKPPTTYNPPQLDVSNAASSAPLTCFQVNWLSHRSPLCAPPGLPCCSCVAWCNSCFPGVHYVDLNEPDEWITAMLSTPAAAAFPQELLGGAFWMDDNFAPEVLLTFHDANWVSSSLGAKLIGYNWTHDVTCFGCLMKTGTAFAPTAQILRLEVSPDKKWIMLNIPSAQTEATGVNTIFMYRPDVGEKFAQPDGSEVEWEVGDFMRITWDKPFAENSTLIYQYMARRAAYRDASKGALVKTRAYDKLVGAAAMPLPHANTCCGYGNCNLSQQFFLDNFAAQNRWQQVIYAPAPPAAKSE